MSDSPQLVVEWENGRAKIERARREAPLLTSITSTVFFSSPSYLSQNTHLIRLPEVKASVT